MACFQRTADICTSFKHKQVGKQSFFFFFDKIHIPDTDISIFGCFSLPVQQIILTRCTVCSVQTICCWSNSLWHPWCAHGILGVVMERTPSMLEDSCGSKAKKLLASSDRCHYSCFSLHALSAAPSSTWAFHHWGWHDLLSLSIPIPGKHKCCFDGFHKYW